MQNVLKNKYFITVIVFLLCIFIFTSNCFATFNFVYNNTGHSLQDYNEKQGKKGYNSHVYYFMEHANLDRYHTDKTICFIFNEDVSLYSNLYIKSDKPEGFTGNVWCLFGTNSENKDVFITARGMFYYLSENKFEFFTENGSYPTSYNNFINANVNIYNTDNTLVFQKAPLTVEQVTIPQIAQVEEIPQVMTQVMKMIMPIGLIIFGIGLIILLVRLVISHMT